MGRRYNPTYGRSAVALAESLAQTIMGNGEASRAHAEHSETLLSLGATEDALAEVLRAGLEECERLRSALDRVTALLQRIQHDEECLITVHECCGEGTDYDEPGHPRVWRCYGDLERAECERERVRCTCGLDALLRAAEVSRG